MRYLRIPVTLFAALAVLAVSGPALAADGAESVEALMKQMDAAAASGNASQVLALIHPDDRPLYGFGMVMIGSFTPLGFMSDEKKAEAVGAEWETLLAKHHIDMTPDGGPPAEDPAEMKMRARALFKKVDLPAFVNDAAGFLKKYRKADDTGPMIPAPTGTAEGLKVDGDSATATVEGKPQKFSRVDGRWYIHLEM